MDGQYLGPIPEMFPEYIADRWVLSDIIWCVVLLVLVIKHDNCSWCFLTSPVNDINGVGVSPGCSSITDKSKVDIFTLAGVPVLSRPIGSFNS